MDKVAIGQQTLEAYTLAWIEIGNSENTIKGLL